MDGLITFGSVVTFKNKSRYVFLAEIGSTTYLARIVEERATIDELMAMRVGLERQIEKGSTAAIKKIESLIYCFVVLETSDFESCLAWMVKPSMDKNQFDPVYNWGRLVKQDLEKLEKMIVDNEGIPRELRDYIKNKVSAP